MVSTYYPKICACNIESDHYVKQIPAFLTAGASSSYRCYEDNDDLTSALVDCSDSDLDLLVYDVTTCFEDIGWYYCYDDSDGTVTGESEQAFISRHNECDQDDQNEFANTFYLYIDSDHEFYISDADLLSSDDFNSATESESS